MTQNPVLELSLKDLTVGQHFISAPYTLTTEEIKSYATQFDPQPFHMDEEAARHSPFGGLVASGWHTASISMRLIVNSIHLDCGLIGLGGTLNWRKPVRPHESIHVESEITDITPSKSKPGQAVVGVKCLVKNQLEETVIDFATKLMVFGSY
jgi:acyl dehydratase